MAVYVRKGVQRSNRRPWLVMVGLIGLGAACWFGRGKLSDLWQWGARSPIAIKLNRAEYGQGDVVEMEVRVRAGDAVRELSPPTVRVLDKDAKPLRGVGGGEVVAMRLVPETGRWKGRWPVPWGAKPRRVLAQSL